MAEPHVWRVNQHRENAATMRTAAFGRDDPPTEGTRRPTSVPEPTQQQPHSSTTTGTTTKPHRHDDNDDDGKRVEYSSSGNVPPGWMERHHYAQVYRNVERSRCAMGVGDASRSGTTAIHHQMDANSPTTMQPTQHTPDSEPHKQTTNPEMQVQAARAQAEGLSSESQ